MDAETKQTERKQAQHKDVYPLSWPEDWPRTRPQDRKQQKQWKLSANNYRELLKKELSKMGCDSYLISSNVQLTERERMVPGLEPMDTGVTVYFTRKAKRDFGWQDVFGIHDPAPTEEQVNAAYKKLAQRYHTDVGGDIEMFHAINKHRENALNWINRRTNQKFDTSIPCDVFEEVRWNMAAIIMALKAFRQLDRCGIPSLLDRAYKGFAALAEHSEGGAK